MYASPIISISERRGALAHSFRYICHRCVARGRNMHITGLACIRAAENCGHSEDPREGSGDLQILLPPRHPRSTMKARNFCLETSIYNMNIQDSPTCVVKYEKLTKIVSFLWKFLASGFCMPLPPRTQQNIPKRPLSPAKDRY